MKSGDVRDLLLNDIGATGYFTPQHDSGATHRAICDRWNQYRKAGKSAILTGAPSKDKRRRIIAAPQIRVGDILNFGWPGNPYHRSVWKVELRQGKSTVYEVFTDEHCFPFAMFIEDTIELVHRKFEIEPEDEAMSFGVFSS